MRLEGLSKLKESTSPGTRTDDLPACSIAPQPTTLPRAVLKNKMFLNLKLSISENLIVSVELGLILLLRVFSESKN
jgi:hypothetical protein